ncbi:2'-5' RNA ligase family protein [Halobacillus salinarum]|uniref:2'-5' RNA ligase family protein n=1 Tax=Halobacillus salinarum TaxID=2932257 RepID=A0ABY4EDS8_9BACI|nr:2'-5' RNA ligase family protein [Halobacillus salinarum]UOQ42606.1 2'-5' RNA ligase family protein [Halobacillus salinarum]
MYGFIALFDRETEMKIRAIWKELEEKSISSYAEQVKDRRPHLTLASYVNVNEEKYIQKIRQAYENQSELELTFPSIGSFLQSGALFYSPILTEALMQLHRFHYRTFEEWHSESHPLYRPDQWIPHCTLANRLGHDKLLEAYNYCLQVHHSIHGKINRVALIKAVPLTNNRRKEELLFSLPLWK